MTLKVRGVVKQYALEDDDFRIVIANPKNLVVSPLHLQKCKPQEGLPDEFSDVVVKLLIGKVLKQLCRHVKVHVGLFPKKRILNFLGGVSVHRFNLTQCGRFVKGHLNFPTGLRISDINVQRRKKGVPNRSTVLKKLLELVSQL
jgi:hypothetical protein